MPECGREGIYGLDLAGRTRFVNPAAAAMTGHAVHELLGRTMHDVLHHLRPDGRRYPRDECPIDAPFADGRMRKVGDEVFWRQDGSNLSCRVHEHAHRVLGTLGRQRRIHRSIGSASTSNGPGA